jgi:glycerophosphoryl diester phosphodiesterase
MSYSELQHIRAHEPDRFSLAFFNQHIPRLQDIIELLNKFPHVTAFVEIKEDTLNHYGINSVMDDLFTSLDAVQSQCVIISFDDKAIEYTQHNSNYHTGWVLHNYDDSSHERASELKPDYLIVNHRKLPNDSDPWQGDWQWMVYDVTDPELALHYASHNIDFIESRDICTLFEHPILALNLSDHPIEQRQ